MLESSISIGLLLVGFRGVETRGVRVWRETSSSGGKQASGDIKLAGGSSQTETSGVRRCACFVAHVCVTPGARVCLWRAHVRTSQHSNMPSERLQNVLPLSDAFCRRC